MNKKKLIGVLALIVVISASTFFILKYRKGMVRDGEPQKTVEEILKERERQSALALQTPLAKIFYSKNWTEFNKQYDAEKDFFKLGEMLRAGFIGGSIKSFTPEDMSNVLSILIDTFDKLKPSDYPRTGLLVTQFERIPSPKHDSENYKRLETWYNKSDSGSLKKRLAIEKIVIQDSSPDQKWMKVVVQGVMENSFLKDQHLWAYQIGNMRSVVFRSKVLTELSKNFSQIADSAQPVILVLFAQDPSLAAKSKSIFMKYLYSKDSKKFEAALKSVIPLHEAKVLTPGDLDKIRSVIGSVPESLNTPYVEQKVKEIFYVIH